MSKVKKITEKVMPIIAEHSGVELSKIKTTSSLSDDLAMDSLDCVELLMFLEGEFEIDIDDGDGATFTTPQHIIDYLVENT